MRAEDAAVHSFFIGGVKQAGDFLPSPPTLIHYLHLDPFSQATVETPAVSAVSGSSPPPAVAGPSTPSPKKIRVVFYDLDGTLIKTRLGSDFPKSRDDWAWWHPSVPKRLKQEVGEGRHLIVISNQGDPRPKIRTEWKAKVPLIAAKVCQISVSHH